MMYSLDVMDFLARQTFKGEMSKIYMLDSRRNEMFNFYGHHINSSGGRCYFLTVLALMGLDRKARRICGTVDTMRQAGYRANKDYVHAWVEFPVDDDEFVYDPLYSVFMPKSMYWELCNPREITSQLTQNEMLEPFLNEKYAYRITDDCWQFKAEKDAPKPENDRENGYIFNALACGHLKGYFAEGVTIVGTFIARSYYV